LGVPWCNSCDRYLTPNSLNDDGGCPTCGEEAEVQPGEAKMATTEGDRVPWHFWIVVAALAVYLGWRLIQGVSLLF
jgi:hypothetical protein